MRLRGISLEPFKSAIYSDLAKYYDKEEKKSTFSNISVKVRTRVYHRDKAILALKCGYFEKLFINHKDEECTEIDISIIDEGTFSFIVEKYIYGSESLNHLPRYRSELEGQNVVTLFVAMDLLQMEIDVGNFQSLIPSTSYPEENSPAANFRLYNFVAPLLQQIRKVPEFTFLSPDALIKILTLPKSSSTSGSNVQSRYEQHYIAEICAEWICHDFHNRLPRIVDLVNAVKYRYGIPFAISSENHKTFDAPDELKRRETVQKYFYKLLHCNGELTYRPSIIDAEKSKKNTGSKATTIVNKIDHKAKWKTFMKQELFTDVSIRVGAEVFRLHRVKLSLAVPYFHDLFSQSTAQKEYSLDAAVDCDAFRKIVDYIYYEEIDVMNESKLGHLLKACEILDLGNLSAEIYDNVNMNFSKMKNTLFDFLSYVSENYCAIRRLRHDVISSICSSWDEIVEDSQFYEISFDSLENLINLPDLGLKNEQDLLKVCSKWIHHDMKNRYKLIPELALAINRNGMEDPETYSLPLPEDFSTCSENHVLEQLNNILTLTQLVVSPRSPGLATNVDPQPSKPCFLIYEANKIGILDENLVEIFSFSTQTQFQCSDLSAAVVEDNLFMLFYKNDKFSFQVYNQNSKKITSLMFNLKNAWSDFRLLNCNKSLYFFPNGGGDVLKYSCKLNRWTKVFEMEERNSLQQYTSDGKVLCKVFKSRYQYKAQWYNFEKQSWIDFPPFPTQIEARHPAYVSMIDGKLSALFNSSGTAIYQQNTQNWKIIAEKTKEFVTFKQVKDSILYVTRKGKVYSYSIAEESWKLVNKFKGSEKIVAIHSVNE